MILLIPVQQTTDAFIQQIVLDDVTYDLSFRLNAQDQHWMLTIGESGEELIRGVKLVSSNDLLSQHRRIERLPPGRLFIQDLDGLFRDPDDVLFGDRVVLLYEPANA